MRTSYMLVLVVVMVVFAPGAVWAQLSDSGVRIPDGRRLDSLFTALDTSKQFSGAVALVDHGTAVYRRTVGVLGQGDAIASMGTRYRADVLLPLLAVAMTLDAAERGTIQRSAPIIQWFPTLQGAERITVDHLIRYESGLAVIDIMTPTDVWERCRSTDSLISYLNEVGPVCEPGECRSWSATETRLLISLLERATGLPFGEAAARFFRTVGMRTALVIDRDRPVSPRDARPVMLADSTWQAVDRSTLPDEPWQVYTTANDAATFLRALYRPSNLSETLAATMRGLLATSIPMSGTTSSVFGNGTELHSRSRAGSALLTWFDRSDLAIVILSNGSTIDDEALRRSILAMIPQR